MNKSPLIKRITNQPSNKIAIIPLDYGMYKGPIPELAQIAPVLSIIAASGLGAVLLHKGLLKQYSKLLSDNDSPYFLHITASTGLGNPLKKVQISSVAEAKELGAIGISMTLYLGNYYEPDMLEFLGRVSEEADKYELLLYVMMYVARSEDGKIVEDKSISSIKWAARIGFEAGVDIIEIRQPTDSSNLNEIKAICPVPLLVADSASYSEEAYINLLQNCSKSNIDGISISKRILDISQTQKLIDRTETILFNC